MAPRAAWISAELVRLLYRHAPAVIAANIVNGTLMLVALWPSADRAILLGWCAAILALNFVRLGSWLYSRHRLTMASAAYWNGWYTVGAGISAGLWGSTAWLFIDPDNPHTLLLVSFVIGGMAAGAVTGLSAHLPAFYLYIFGSVLPFLVRLLTLGGQASLAMAGMATVYVIGLVVIGRNFNAALITALELNEENRALLANREQEIRQRTADLQLANAELKREIGERKAIAIRLKEAREEADQANLAKSRFLAAASHDLRQPLQSMYMFASVLHRQLEADGKGVEALMRIERGLDILKGLLDGLLDLTRLDVNVIHPNLTAFRIKPMLEDIAAAYGRVAASKGIRLVGAPICDVIVHSDPVLLGRMIRNLVENALRYTEKGLIQLSCEVNYETARIEVCDTGIGIAEDQLERIFEEFHQIGNPERDKTRGLGLGLAIVQRLSLILEHPVEVRSQLSIGTTFSIQLPATSDASLPSAPAEEPTGDFGAGRRVTVIDDDPMVLLALSGMFEQWGFAVTMAGAADDALAQFRTDAPPHLIIADYRLRSGQIGTEAIRALRQASKGDIPAIVLTGETGAECATEAEELGAAVLHKPVTPRDLALTLLRLKAVETIRGA